MKDPEQFGREWCATWSRRDAEAILAHYSDDVRFVSPTAAVVTGNPVVEGKAGLRAYWMAGLEQIWSIEFEFDHTVWDESRAELLVLYTRRMNQGTPERACELFRFGPDGQVFEGEALYGARFE